MGDPPHNTYINIPPPPLPEFYMPKKAGGDVASASSGAEEVEAAASFKASKTFVEQATEREQYRYPPMPGDGTDERVQYATRKAGSDLSSLAVYHICRICLRPRSARYHREHPIPVDGLPPPPGICRKCRVTSVEDTRSMAEVVERRESHGPKLGVKCLVDDEDYLPPEKVRLRRDDYAVDEVEWRELEPPPRKESPRKQEYIYKHIHVTVPPPPVHPPPATSPPDPPLPPPEPMFMYVPRPTVKSTAQDAIDSVSEKSAKSAKKTRYEIRRVEERVPVGSPPGSDLRHIDKKVTQASSKAKSEVEIRSSSARSTAPKPEWTESEIRNLARDEVERYRQAERKMEAHGDAYAHGRMMPIERTPVVPVERRIEAERDTASAMPWRAGSDSNKREYKMSTKNKDDEREILFVHKRRNERHLDERAMSPPSDAASDKTRWPSTKYETRRNAYSQGPSRNDAIHEKTAEVSYQRETSRSRYDEKATTGHWIDYKRPQERVQIRERKAQVAEAGPDDISHHPKHHHQRVALAYDRRDSGVAGLAKDDRKQKVLQRTQELDLPYPQDDLDTPVPMPSPSSHASRPVKNVARPRDKDSEYYYKLRTVRPADEEVYLRDDRTGEYYREESEYLHRRKAAAEPKEPEAPQVTRKKVDDRRPSDASSRVRFSKKVNISPTPPGSDASSAQFRSQEKAKSRVADKGPDKVVDFEYERRGRAPSRVAPSEYDYYYGQDAKYYAQQAYRRQDSGGAARPAIRGRRPSGETETATAASTLPIDVRMLARAQSESPSREKLLTAARRQRQDGFGPYTVEHNRSTSVEAYDGSSVGGASDSDRARRKERRERREHREYAERQSKR